MCNIRSLTLKRPLQGPVSQLKINPLEYKMAKMAKISEIHLLMWTKTYRLDTESNVNTQVHFQTSRALEAQTGAKKTRFLTTGALLLSFDLCGT